MICPACLNEVGDYDSTASHMVREAYRSDVIHVMWLNRNISKKRMEVEEVRVRLEEFFRGEPKEWIMRRFVERFLGDPPHPFVEAMQRPTREVLLGYVLEHQHFLRQWVISLSTVISRTKVEEIRRMEAENITEEYVGCEGRPPHLELLIRMGVALGMRREDIVNTPPLKRTRDALAELDRLSRTLSPEAVSGAMHSLELIAHRGVRDYGAKYTYFDPSILKSGYPREVVEFLREGYDEDVKHSEYALELASEHADPHELKVGALKAWEAFDSYLLARLERARSLG